MTKRRLLRWSLFLVILAAFAVWLEPTRVAWGWLRGEAFYGGRPTSYWAAEIGRWQLCGKGSFNWREEPYETWHFSVRPSVFEKWIDRCRENARPTFPAVLKDDPGTRVVLEELTAYPDSHVQEIANERLRGTKMYGAIIRVHGGVGP